MLVGPSELLDDDLLLKMVSQGPVLKNVCVPPTSKFWPKVPPQKARNRDKAELATKVRNQVQTVLM